ncbi:hypothetical protein ACIGXM_33640 [Kitasatospora sp. NPDC052896]|uniref:hypothetical protein n=1 Tax=Kitasatospora sp. NPDC052896 TaxID=3364061 RepID=UPI0037C6736A
MADAEPHPVSHALPAPDRADPPQERPMAHRYWCGECGFKTPWLSRTQGEHQQIAHYAKRHPGVPPGGHVEFRRGNPDRRRGCLHRTTTILLLLSFAVACHH